MSGHQKLQLAERLYFKFPQEFDNEFPNSSPRAITAKIRNLSLNLAIEMFQSDEDLKNYCIRKLREMKKSIYELNS